MPSSTGGRNSTHPGQQAIDHGRDALLSHGETLRQRCPIDGALGLEDRVDPAHGFHGERRAAEFGQFEQAAPLVRPAPAEVTGAGLRSASNSRL
ncbi:hypothetical protein AAJCM20276_05930 [Acetobacter aceti]|uniref:Uncharacterized protein n=1 Tax=Acetobacter aceti TaxID=435 RepID=A0A6S6PF26_ACEAC|nr:hypothetical protein AAJCM20276_05930 [Acetobacter aceti]